MLLTKSKANLTFEIKFGIPFFISLNVARNCGLYTVVLEGYTDDGYN